jgi:hypothetical protein
MNIGMQHVKSVALVDCELLLPRNQVHLSCAESASRLATAALAALSLA